MQMFQNLFKPAHFVPERPKQVGANEVGDGRWKEGRPKFPLVTDDDYDDDDEMMVMVMTHLPMVSIMWRGREGSSMAMPMLAKVIAPEQGSRIMIYHEESGFKITCTDLNVRI